jgi:predicted ATPase
MSTTSEAAVIVQFNPTPGGRYKPGADARLPLERALEGKYASLGEVPRRVLGRLSMFVEEFTREAALAVAGCSSLDRSGVSTAIAALLASSLLESSCGDDAGVNYLLTLPTRRFALGKLVCHGEQDLVARKHAQYLQCVLEYAEVEFDRREPGRWMTYYDRLIGDVRAALDWAFSPSGDASIGVDLTMAAIPLWLTCSQPDELQRRIGRALKSGAALSHPGRQIRLRTAARLAGMSDF